MITTKNDLLSYQSVYHLGVPSNRESDVNLVIRTSGSSGNPLTIAMNNIDFEKITDVGARCFINAGVKPGMKIIHCLNFQMWAGGFVDCTSLMKAGAAVFPYGVGNTKELINTIMYYDIEGISCTPSYMRRIKQVLKEEFNMNPKNLGLKYGFFGGESGIQNPSFKKNIEEEWGIEALNANYGSADTISILASENYNTRDGLQFLADDIATARIKVGDRLLTPSKGLVGELIITTNYDGGLISRFDYSIGDIIEVTSDGPNFKFNVVGRADEMVVVRGLNVYPSAIRDIVSEAGLVYGYPSIMSQLLVSREDPIERAVLRVDLNDPDHKDCEHLVNYLTKELQNRLSLSIPVVCSELELSDTGKLKLVRRVLD